MIKSCGVVVKDSLSSESIQGMVGPVTDFNRSVSPRLL